jgi:hypothetical protein
MAILCVYEIATGLVRWNTTCPDGMESVQTEDSEELDHIVVESEVNGRTHYVLSGVLTARPVIAFDTLAIDADDTDVATVDLEETFNATIDGVDHVITGGLLEIASPMPASYSVVIRHWPFQDFAATVVAS